MQTSAFFGGRPNIAVRATYAVVAALALTLAIWDLPLGDNLNYLGHQAVQVLHVVTMFAIAGVSVAQVVAPVRFAWPGWILLAAVLLPGSAGSLTWAIDSLTYGGSYGPSASFFVHLLLVPAFYSLALLGALIAWHLQPNTAANDAAYEVR
jgi:hypothetical protein